MVKRKRSYDPAEKFISENDIPFHHDLPLIDNQRPVRSIQAIVYEAYLQAEPLHPQKNLMILADKQLEVILRNASPHHDEVRNWGMSFAELHKLNYEEILRKSASKKKYLFSSLKKVMMKLESLIFMFSIHGNQNVSLTDVFQASIIAGRIKSNSPGVYMRITNILVRLRKRLSSTK